MDSARRRIRFTALRLGMPAVLLMSLASGMGLLAFDVAIGPRLSLTADAPEGM